MTLLLTTETTWEKFQEVSRRVREHSSLLLTTETTWEKLQEVSGRIREHSPGIWDSLKSRENFPGKTPEGFPGNFPRIPLVLGKASGHLKNVPERSRKLLGMDLKSRENFPGKTPEEFQGIFLESSE
jgi:hypothetical protein